MQNLSMRRVAGVFATVSSFALIAACAGPESAGEATTSAGAAPTAEDARAFVEEVEKVYADAGEEAARIAWINNTYINYDSNWLSAKNGAEITKLAVDFANEAKKFNGLDLPADVARKIDFIKQGVTIPAPSTEGAAEELSEINTRLGSRYSTGRIDLTSSGIPADRLAAALKSVRDPKGENPDTDLSASAIRQDETELLMRQSRDPEILGAVWTAWHATPMEEKDGKTMKDDYARMVEIANEGARELGFADVGTMWRAGYDMEPDEFAAEVDRLWGQVKPLYDELHCYVRAELNEKYGDEVVPLGQPIRADLLGNMWAQEWGSIGDIVTVGGAGGPAVDLDARLVERGYDPIRMVKTGENFFSSLGFEPLPGSFWERSQIVKPKDREVVCHASAWNLDNKDDLRIKMCTTVSAEDFTTIHHELGHNYYQRAYNKQPNLFQGGANDGFHEAIGDMVALSITPDYLKTIGLIDEVPPASEDLSLLLRQALDKVAFLPFGLLVDKWRWQVFSGEVAPDQYNAGWWALRTQYQGIRPPSERDPAGFDAGAKYHVPNNVPYMRYFLARILQFQFYKAACDQIGWEGPLHRCSFYGSKEVGEKFNAMLEMGASRPWPEALEAFTGTREIDGSALVEYFAPLMAYLKDENEGRQCGW